MFERYIMVKDTPILCGQNTSGVWLCKELPAKTVDEIDELIPKINAILNKYNTLEKKQSVKKDMVRGVKDGL